MGFKNIQGLTGITLSVLLGIGVSVPAIANPASNRAQTVSQMDETLRRGRITSIAGRVLTVELENGETETVGVSSAMSREIVPGTEVLIRDGEIVEFGPFAEDEMEGIERAMVQTGPMRGRITSVVGSLITVKLENGETETIGVSSARSRGIVPGSQVLVQDGEIVDYGPYLGG